MKTIRVAAAVICDELQHPTKILATARGYGEYAGQWEFPGGKLEPGETAPEALVREIAEELDVTIRVGRRIATVEHDYPTFHLSMDCYFCVVTDGNIVLKEAKDACWLTADELRSVQWLPADETLLPVLEENLRM